MSNVCKNCGATLPAGASFCGNCGNKVEAETPPVAHGQESVVKKSASAPRKSFSVTRPPEQFETLKIALSATVALSILSAVIGFFDVREYYFIGRFGYVLLSVTMNAIGIWLVAKVFQRRNWARVTYVVYELLLCVLGMLGYANSENGSAFLCLVDIALIGLTVYCIVLLLNKEMAQCFIKIIDGVKRALVFWGVFIASMVFLGIYSDIHESSSGFLNDCVAAAAKDSDEAYSSLVQYCIEHSNYSGTEEDVLQAAMQDADMLIAQRTPYEIRRPEKKNSSKEPNGGSLWGWLKRNAKLFMCLGVFIVKFLENRDEKVKKRNAK